MTKLDSEEKLRKLCSERLRTKRENSRFKTAAAFAKAVGQHAGTYTHHENGTRGFGALDAMKYAKELKVSASYLMGLAGDEATETFEVSIMGEAALTTWYDRSLDGERNKNKDNTLPIPNPSGHAVRYAILVKDDSVNKAVPVGEYAVCVPIDQGDIEPGMLVDVEHVRGNLVQRTIRRVIAKTKGGFHLKTYSTLAQFESSLSYPSERRDEDISIMGRVVGHYGEFDLIKS